MSEKKERPKPWSEFRKGSNRLVRPLWAMEWGCEWLAYGLSRWAFLEVLEYAGKLTIVVALVAYIFGAHERKRNAENQRQAAEDQRKAKHFQAWQVINTAQGKGGDGGRVLALNELDKNRVPLAGINLDHAYLFNLTLTNHPLAARASMDASVLHSCVINNANLFGANFSRAAFEFSVISNCSLAHAGFTNARLSLVQFLKTDLAHAKLISVNSQVSSFSGSSLHHVDVTGSQFYKVNFANASLEEFKGWTNATFYACNFYGVKSAPPHFLDWVMRMGGIQTNITDFKAWQDFASGYDPVLQPR